MSRAETLHQFSMIMLGQRAVGRPFQASPTGTGLLIAGRSHKALLS